MGFWGVVTADGANAPLGIPSEAPSKGLGPGSGPTPPPTPFLPHSLTHSHSLTHARPRALPPIPLSQTTYTHPTPPSLRVFTRSIRRQRDRQTVVPSTWVNPVDGCRSFVCLFIVLLTNTVHFFFFFSLLGTLLLKSKLPKFTVRVL